MKRTNFVFCVLLVLVCSIIIPQNTSDEMSLFANFEVPVAVGATGLIFTPENSSLMMSKADVNYDIEYAIISENYTKPNHYLNYDFFGSYIVYNPNETVLATGVIPLSESSVGDRVKNLEVKVNDSLFAYDVIPVWTSEYNDVIDKYLPFDSSVLDWAFGIYQLIVFNVIFESNLFYNVTYSYSFSLLRGPYSISTSYDFLSGIDVHYILSTSQLWNNYIDETVVMSVKGKQPNSYTHNLQAYVYDIGDTVCYNWSWYDEPITEDYVGISYDYLETSSTGTGISLLYFPLILVTLSFILKRKRKL